MVARVLLLMSAGLSAQPRPPGVRLSRAPLYTRVRNHTSSFETVNRIRGGGVTGKWFPTYPGANWEEAISPGFRPAAAAIAAKLALVGSWAAPCRAADSPGAATIT